MFYLQDVNSKWCSDNYILHVYLFLWNKQIVDPVEIEKMVDKIIADNPKQLEQYRSGKTKIQGFFAGQVWFRRKWHGFHGYAFKSCFVWLLLV